jgi:predicted Zn-dependent protease
LTAGFRIDRLGEEALRLAEADQFDVARQLLAWAFEDLSVEYSMLNPFAGSPMLRLWKKSDVRTADKSRIRLAAIALASPENVPDPVSFLNEMRSTAKPAEQQQIDRVLVEWLTENDRTKEALEVVERLMEKKQGRDANWYLKGRLLVNDGQFGAAIDLAKAEQERDATFTLPMRLESLAKRRLCGITFRASPNWRAPAVRLL